MTKDTFYKAMLEIDDELVLDNIPRSFEADKKTKKAWLSKILIPLAASFLVLAAVLVPFIARTLAPVVTDRERITVGFDLPSGGKPLPRQRIALSAFCFNPAKEPVTVEAAMGDSYGTPEKFGEGGYPAFRVYVTEDLAWDTAVSSPLSVNGGGSSYEHKFGRDDMESLDITGKVDDRDSYYREEVFLDFKGFKAGDSGIIIFEFSWNYDPADPETGSEKDFQRRPLYFYVGADTVVFSFSSKEDAERIYTENAGRPLPIFR